MRRLEWLVIFAAAALALAVILSALPDPTIRSMTHGTVAARGRDEGHYYFEVSDGEGHWDWWTVSEEAFGTYGIGDRVSLRLVGAK